MWMMKKGFSKGKAARKREIDIQKGCKKETWLQLMLRKLKISQGNIIQA